MKRRTFVIEAGKAFPVVAGAIYLIGCGSSSTAPSAYADVSSTSTLVNGHTHTENVPASDQHQQNPADMTYTSSTTLSHVHMVTLTGSQLASLGSGGSVTVTSTVSAVTGTHQHDFTFQGKK